MLNSPDMDEIIKALAHPLRREILVWLKTPEVSFPAQVHSFELGVCAGKIFEKASLSQSTMSTHLAILQRAGLVTTKKVGQWIFYVRNESMIEEFLNRITTEL
ncbi:MAG: helix-turn-helix transcriptional regulator [Ferrovum sp.]|nr:helix-turn-helix transcriptional regulator [Ferrovum sp.]NDU87295.1 helix-turn-helix transcriptional regulator [Ferrovum sp.]